MSRNSCLGASYSNSFLTACLLLQAGSPLSYFAPLHSFQGVYEPEQLEKAVYIPSPSVLALQVPVG